MLVSGASALWHGIDIEGQGAVVNLTQLMAFQAVANSGSITKAAQLLHVSQKPAGLGSDRSKFLI